MDASSHQQSIKDEYAEKAEEPSLVCLQKNDKKVTGSDSKPTEDLKANHSNLWLSRKINNIVLQDILKTQ